jgi:hypothetical protein
MSAFTDLIDAAERAAAAPDTAWQPMEDAPRDGTPIIGRVDGEPLGIQWTDERRCMMAGIAGGYGYFGEGWEDTYNHLVIYDGQVVDGWLPLPDA